MARGLVFLRFPGMRHQAWVARRRWAVAGFCAWSGLIAFPLWAGGITGTVRGPDGLPRQGARITAYDAVSGAASSAAVSAADGSYLVEFLPTASYFVHATAPSPNPEHLTGELYAGIPSNAFCFGRGTEVAVDAAATTWVDLTLGAGLSIHGALQPLPNDGPLARSREVFAYDLRGCRASSGLILNGGYEIRSLPAGRYRLVTDFGSPQVDQLYPNLPCVAGQCDLTPGTPVAAGATVDFSLVEGGSIAGTITAAGGVPLGSAEVSLWRGAQRLVTLVAQPDGSYLFGGLPVATGYRVLATHGGFVGEVYPNAPCPGAGCNVGGVGGGIDIPAAGTAITGRDIELAPGHAIRGSLAPSATPATVYAFGSTGFAGQVAATGTYAISDLPDGNYILRAKMATGLTELYDNRLCPANQVCLGDPVHVAGADVSGVNFTLAAARRILGTVRNAAGDPIGGVAVEVSDPDGTLMSVGQTLLDGTYATATEGLPAGTYFLRTRLPRRIHQYLDRVWPQRPCGATCIPSTGTPVVVGGVDVGGIDFVLPYSGLDFFTVTPCRVFDSRDAGGPTIATGVLRVLRLEAACRIPGNAVAVSANVTVTSASASGTITLWSANLAPQPTATTISVDAGVTRANNAVLNLALEGLLNVAFRGTLGAGGRYHLIVDVNGYFASSTPP